jgi:hypothetical protein
LYAPVLGDTPFNYWSNDTSYEVSKKRDPNTRLDSYYVTGDIIKIDEDQFPSLARAANSPNTNVQSVTFDARILILDMPLVFDTTQITFFAEKVVLTSRAAILLNAVSPQPGGDGISIITDELDLSNSKTRPFQFKTDNWEFLTDGAQQPWPTDRKRNVKVDANRLLTSDPLASEDLFRFFRNLTLDQKYGYAPGSLSKAPYSIHVADDAASQVYEEFFTSSALWPDQFSAKVARQFSRAPFDPENTKFLRTTFIGPYTERFRGHHESALLTLNEVSTAIRLGVDGYGENRYYVPRISLEATLANFKEDVPATLNLVKVWDSEIAKGFVGGAVDAVKVQQVRKELDKEQAELADAESELGHAMASLTQNEQAIEKQLGTIKDIEDRIQANLQELIAKDEKNRTLLTGTRIVAAVASVIPATAPVGMILGQAVLVTGDAIYRHNANQAVTPQTVISVVQTGVEFVGKVRALRDSWDKLHSAIEKTQDPHIQGNDKRAEVNKAFVDAGRDFAEKSKNVYDLLQIPAATPISMNELEKDNPELKAALEQLASFRVEESKNLSIVHDLTTIASQKSATLIASQQRFYEVLKADLRNDNFIARQRNLGIQVRDQLFGHLSYEAATLRRSYAYHTGRQLDAPSDVAFFSDDYKSISLKDLTADSVEKVLSDQRTQVELSYGSLERLVGNGINDYLARRTLPAPVSKEFVADAKNVDDPDQIQFLRILNMSISEGTRLTAETYNPGLFFVPFEDCQQEYQLSKLPYKLLHIEVKKVVFENKTSMSGKTIEFHFVHPGYGFESDERGCFFVDFRKADALQNSAIYTTTVNNEGPIDSKNIQSLYTGSLADLNKYARYPFCSKYFLYAVLKGSPRAANWRQVPRIKYIEIVFYAVQ